MKGVIVINAPTGYHCGLTTRRGDVIPLEKEGIQTPSPPIKTIQPNSLKETQTLTQTQTQNQTKSKERCVPSSSP
jgi:hypothetical protein